MNITLTNINKFVEQLTPTNDTNWSDLFEQYYCFERKEKISIYKQLIIILNNNFQINDMTEQQKQEYRNCFNFLNNEIKKAKRNYQTEYNKQIKKLMIV